MTKRLTEKQKEEILKSFKSGIDIDFLSKKHNCTYSTIARYLKRSLAEFEYKELLKKSKLSKEKSKIYKKQNNELKKTNFDNEEFKNNPKELSDLNENISVSNFAPIDSFFEIAPIDYEMDNSFRKELSSVPLSEVDFPKVVYMIVDKKIFRDLIREQINKLIFFVIISVQRFNKICK